MNIAHVHELHERIELLQAMELIVRSLNDTEGLDYWLMEGVPDGADDEDFLYCANDNELFRSIQETFHEVISKHGGSGWFKYNWDADMAKAKGKLVSET